MRHTASGRRARRPRRCRAGRGRSPARPRFASGFRRRALRRRAARAAMRAGVSGRSSVATPSASATALAMHTGVDMQLPSPTPLAAERGERRGRLEVQDHRLRHLHRGRHQIVGESAGRGSCRPARRRIPRRAPRPSAWAKPPVTCPATMPGCRMRPQSCMVTYLSIRTAPVTRSISTPQKSKMKPWQSEELTSSASVGGGQLRRRPEHRLAERPIRPPGPGRAPSGWWRRAARTQIALSGLPRAWMRPLANSMSSGGDVELRRRDARELGRDLVRREMRGAADRRGEPARIVAGRDRPGVARGIQLGDDADVGRL